MRQSVLDVGRGQIFLEGEVSKGVDTVATLNQQTSSALSQSDEVFCFLASRLFIQLQFGIASKETRESQFEIAFFDLSRATGLTGLAVNSIGQLL